MQAAPEKVLTAFIISMFLKLQHIIRGRTFAVGLVGGEVDPDALSGPRNTSQGAASTGGDVLIAFRAHLLVTRGDSKGLEGGGAIGASNDRVGRGCARAEHG